MVLGLNWTGRPQFHLSSLRGSKLDQLGLNYVKRLIATKDGNNRYISRYIHNVLKVQVTGKLLSLQVLYFFKKLLKTQHVFYLIACFSVIIKEHLVR